MADIFNRPVKFGNCPLNDVFYDPDDEQCIDPPEEEK